MNEYEYEINGRSYKVTVAEVNEGDSAVVEVNGESYQVSILSQPSAALPSSAPQAGGPSPAAVAPPPKAAAPKPAASAGGGAVTSPMPGTVLKVLVNQGDAVDSGQPVMIIEAMKMENEIKASRSGTVSKVLVSAGDNVAAGAPLLNIE